MLLPAPPAPATSGREDGGLEQLDLGLDLSDALHGIKFGPDLADAVGRSLASKEVPTHRADFLTQCIRSMVGNFA